MNPGALDGLVVVDFSRVLAGPYATMMLGDFGAEVIKIERPQVGDDTREWGPPYDSEGVATYFNAVNRNKRSVVLDLTDPADQQRARELVATADIVVENFRAGTMEKFGLDYETMRASKPDLIYCSITGFGRDRGAALPGYDLLVQAVGGLMSVTGPGPDEPTKVGVALVDVLAGLHALVGILAALAHRDRTGQGQRVDTDLLSVLLSSLVNQASGYLGAGAVPGIMGNRHPSIAPYQTFPTADRPIALAVGNDKQFKLLAEAMNLPWLADDSRFASNPQRVHNRDALAETLGAVLKTPRRRPLVRDTHSGGRARGPDQQHRRGVHVRRTARPDRVGARTGKCHTTSRQPHFVVGDSGQLPECPTAPRRRNPA